MPWARVSMRDNQCLMKIEFQPFKIKKFQRYVVWYVDILSTTDLQTSKCLRLYMEYYVFVTKIKKKI